MVQMCVWEILEVRDKGRGKENRSLHWRRVGIDLVVVAWQILVVAELIGLRHWAPKPDQLFIPTTSNMKTSQCHLPRFKALLQFL